MKNLFSMMLLCMLCACNWFETPVCCTDIDTITLIKFLNSEGENLIYNGELLESDIQIYHLIEGEWERYYEGNLNYPKGIRIDERDGELYLTIFPSTITDAEGVSETKIEFSESDFDILKAEVNKANGNEIITRVWYNEDLKWESSRSERMFEVVR